MDDRELHDLLEQAVDAAVAYRGGLRERLHRPELSYPEMRARFATPVPEQGSSPKQVIAELIEKAEAGLATMTGPRFFGWVIGGTEPAGVAADWLTSAWGRTPEMHWRHPRRRPWRRSRGVGCWS